VLVPVTPSSSSTLLPLFSQPLPCLAGLRVSSNRSTNPIYYPVRLLLGAILWVKDQDFQSPRAVHALDAVQLYVRGRRRAGDEGDGPSLGLDGLFKPREGFGDEPYDLILPHHAEVVVGQQRQGSAALALPGVEDDGAGLGDTQSAAGQDAVAA